ncbi:MAG: carboxypeptidase regulatory-like domain-containing protein [Deltaproteobacteria bacterium]|nr:carboxypeptidase regulatory-like domain-containing protein [Deltaproteobacteria bacterium]
MRTVTKFFGFIVAISFSGSSCTDVDNSNPYDPNTPPDKQAKASLSGVVLGLEAGEGAEPAPLVSAAVLLDGPTEAEVNPQTPDAQGAFAFNQLQPGTYTLDVSSTGYFRQVRSYSLDPGQDHDDVRVVLDEIPSGTEDAAHITGLAKLSGEIVLPEDVQDHSGIIVEVEFSGVRTITNLTGEFDLFLNAGTYNLIFSAADYNLVRRNGVVALTGQTVEIPDSPVVLEPNPGSVSGRVQLEFAGTDQHGGVVVAILGIATTASAPDGSYVLSGIPAGVHSIVATHENYDSNSATGIVIRGGIQASAQDIHLVYSRGGVAGQVLLVGENDHSNIVISLTPDIAGNRLSVNTDTGGNYTFQSVLVGTYELTASKDGFSKGVVGSVSVSADSISPVATLNLPRKDDDFDINGGAAYTSNPVVELTLDAVDGAEMRISEDPNFADPGLGDTAYRTYESPVDFTLSTGDGNKTIYTQIKDSDGIEGRVLSASIILDTTPPNIAEVFIDGQATYCNAVNGIVELTFNASDGTSGVSQIQVSNDLVFNEPFEILPASRLHVLADLGTQGEKFVYVHFQDFAGNTTNVPAQASIIYDTIEPSLNSFTVGFGAESNPQYCNSPLVVLNIDSDDAAFMAISNQSGLPQAAYEPLLNGRAWFLTGDEGTKTVYLRLMDAAGNLAGDFSDTIELDMTPPGTPTVLIENGAEYTNTRAPDHLVSVTFSASDATWMRWSTDGEFDTEDWDPIQSPLDISLPTVDGIKTVYLVFKDDAGNLTSSVSDSIILDTTEPQFGSVQIKDGDVYTNSMLVPLTLSVDEIYEMQIWSDASADSEPWVPFARDTVTLLDPSSGDGLQTVSVHFRDQAGNVSSDYSDTITLDTIPPTVVHILTNPMTFNPQGVFLFPIETAGPTTELNFSHYEILGGNLESWQVDSGIIGTTTFTYFLNVSLFEEDGIVNMLQVRAIDLAGNVGPTAAVAITTDNSPPEPVTTGRFWVANGNRQARIHWQASPSSDVVAHRVYYGSASGQYDGTEAVPGISPVTVPGGDRTEYTLAGLTNGSVYYILIRSVDAAGNENVGGSDPDEVTINPNLVSTDLFSETDLAMNYVQRMVVYDDLLYVFGFSGSCGSRSTILEVFDLSQISSPLSGGQIQPAGIPISLSSQTFADSVICNTGFTSYVDMQIDGAYMYLASGNFVHIMDILTPEQPQEVATLDFASPVTGLAVRGNRLYLNLDVVSQVIAVNIDSLFDNNSATIPTLPGDQIGNLAGSSSPLGLTLTRNFLLQTEFATGNLRVYRLDSGLDLTQQLFGFGRRVSAHPRASGNYLYLDAAGTSFWMFDLNGLWATEAMDVDRDVVAEAVVSGQGDFVIEGGQAFLNDYERNGFSSLDLSSAPDILPDGFHHNIRFSVPSAFRPSCSVRYGNYLLAGVTQGSVAAHLQVYEIARPIALHIVAGVTVEAQRSELVGGFLYTDNGEIIDLQSGWPPESQGPSLCSYAGVRVDDLLVQALGIKLRVINPENGIDRDPATLYEDGTVDEYEVDLLAGVNAYGLDVLGNYLVVAEERADGTYLEVFDIMKLRDLQGVQLTAADTLGSYKVSDTTGRAEVSLHHGRALVSIDGDPAQAGSEEAGLHVVDIRPLLDDDPATGMNADSHQGFLALDEAHQCKAEGNYAYQTTLSVLAIIDISLALDEIAATKIDDTVDQASYPIWHASGIDVYGSYAYVVPGGVDLLDTSFEAINISDPLNPTISGYFPIVSTSRICVPVAGQPNLKVRAGVVVSGSRAYLTGNGRHLEIFELE